LKRDTERANERSLTVINWTPVQNRATYDSAKGDHRYELTRQHEALVKIGGTVYRFVVAAGFRYDGATVPHLGSFLNKVIFGTDLDSDGPLRDPSVLHDAGYKCKGFFMRTNALAAVYVSETNERVELLVTRKQLDEIYRQMLNIQEARQRRDHRNPEGRPMLKWREIQRVYKSIRFGGFFLWRKNLDHWAALWYNNATA